MVSSARGIFPGVLPPARHPSHLYLHQEHRHNEPQILILNVNMTLLAKYPIQFKVIQLLNVFFSDSAILF